MQQIGLANIAAHSKKLADQMMRGLKELPNAFVLGKSAKERIALATVSLKLPSMRQNDVARLLADAHGIFLSGGFHCAHVLHHRLRLDGTVRASAHIFNDEKDIEKFSVGAARAVVRSFFKTRLCSSSTSPRVCSCIAVGPTTK